MRAGLDGPGSHDRGGLGALLGLLLGPAAHLAAVALGAGLSAPRLGDRTPVSRCTCSTSAQVTHALRLAPALRPGAVREVGDYDPAPLEQHRDHRTVGNQSCCGGQGSTYMTCNYFRVMV